MSIYEISVQNTKGDEVPLSKYKGKVLLIVNTASQCGFTSQYAQLQKLYETYRDKGLEILAFPCNQFGHQEPGSNEEIQQFCDLNYRVSFPVFSKINVNGEHAHPLYQYLRSEQSGILGNSIKWNFTKFLVARNGKVLDRFAPSTSPQSLSEVIERMFVQDENAG